MKRNDYAAHSCDGAICAAWFYFTTGRYATQRAAGKANILIANLDPVNSASITPKQSSAWTTANVLQVKAGTNNGCTDSVITVGGQSIGEGGTWSGAPFSINNGDSITLGPCEAALISVQ